MNASELLDALAKAGGSIEMVSGKPRLRGAKIPEDLKDAIKGQREAVMAEWARREAAGETAAPVAPKDPVVPPADAPMIGAEYCLKEAWKEQMIDRVMAQPRPMHAWVVMRGQRYLNESTVERGWGVDDVEWRACLDALHWQRKNGDHRYDAEEWAQFLECAVLGKERE